MTLLVSSYWTSPLNLVLVDTTIPDLLNVVESQRRQIEQLVAKFESFNPANPAQMRISNVKFNVITEKAALDKDNVDSSSIYESPN